MLVYRYGDRRQYRLNASAIGLKGIWVFITAFIIAYPATYICAGYLSKTLSESEPVTIIRILSVTILAKLAGHFFSV